MSTVWIDPIRHDRDVLASALEATGHTITASEDADIRIYTSGPEMGDWGFSIPDDPVAAAWFITGWAARDDIDYDDGEIE